MKKFAILLGVLALSGCGTTDPVYLKNAAGAVVQCGPYPGRGMQASASAIRETQCVQDYQRQGYERAPAP